MLYKDKFNSPAGIITVTADDKAVIGIEFNDFCEELCPNNVTEIAITQLKEYFDGKRKAFSVPLYLNGSEFQMKVWQVLMNIPYGEVRTYGEIASIIGSPKAARAIGGANNKNPIPIIIPCHRVVARGGIGGFAPGVKYKKILLDTEKRNSGSAQN